MKQDIKGLLIFFSFLITIGLSYTISTSEEARHTVLGHDQAVEQISEQDIQLAQQNNNESYDRDLEDETKQDSYEHRVENHEDEVEHHDSTDSDKASIDFVSTN